MKEESLNQLVAQGLAALKAGGKVGADAAADIENDAHHPDLKSALRTGSETAEQWQQRIDQALQQTGETTERDNPVMNALYEVGERIRKEAPDDTSRDLGIIANSQLALHYWIASFGTMRSYLSQLGMDQEAQDMQKSTEEAKQGDEQFTALAQQILQ